jgi:20S proteasome alpha/beta subunit
MEKEMTKDEAFKVAAKMLSKLMDSDNSNEDSIKACAYIHTAEAEKDYGKIYTTLEELRKFIVKLQIALKKK